MQAMNGSAVSFRSKGRLVGCLMVLVLALSAIVLAPGVANAQEPATTTYLALGDSISFGYTAERFNNHFPTESPSFFEEGVANDFRKDLGKATEIGKSIRLVNDACPGETSNGLIGENPAVGGETSTESISEVEGNPKEQFPAGGYQGLGDWHPCKYTFENHLPLHNGGYFNPETFAEVSQLEETVASLGSKTSPVKAITLNIGSNDELAAMAQCKEEVGEEFSKEGKSKYGGTPEEAVVNCLVVTSINVTTPHIVKNLNDILGVIDGSGYTGPIVVLGFYNPQSFVLPGSDAHRRCSTSVNKAVEEKVIPNFPNVTYANPFPVFNQGRVQTASAKAEKEAICKYTEMCNPNVQTPGGKPEGKDGDIHPTLAGYKALAKLVNAAFIANPASEGGKTDSLT